jgi:hypothetical protein
VRTVRGSSRDVKRSSSPLHQQATAGSQPTRSAHASVCAALRAEASGRDLGPKKATGDERARCLDRERGRDELDFALSTQTVHTGTVTFKVTNNGGIPHNLRINGKQTFGSEVEASDKQQLRRVELAGLEPATSWVRFRVYRATARHAASGSRIVERNRDRALRHVMPGYGPQC